MMKHARIASGLQVVVCIGLLAGCSADISEADKRYVVASMPVQFESFRMYEVASELGDLEGASPVHFRQGCYADIRDGGIVARERVVIQSESDQVFDLDVNRTPEGWAVTSDYEKPISPDSSTFRARFMKCLSGIQSKYQAQPEKVLFSRQSDHE
jgi:hypothetical protein